MNKIAVIFTRGMSKEEQIKKCEQYAERKGYEVIDVIDGSYEEVGDIDVLLVSDLSRLTRHRGELQGIRETLEKDGIELAIAE